MRNEIQIFNNPEFGNVRVTTNEKGEPLFCLADVCKVLALTTPSRVKDRLNQKGVSNTHTLTNGGMQSMTYINEANLYKCIFQSRKPDAEKFQDWVCEEVLPSIRKHGVYATPVNIDNILSNPEFGIKLLQELQYERQAKERAQMEVKRHTLMLDKANERIATDAPKVAFADAIAAAEGSCHFSDYARLLGRNGVRIGQTRLFEWMRNHGYIGKSGCHRNKPVQCYVNMGVLDLEVQTYHLDGYKTLRFIPKVTPKGMRYFFDKLIREKEFFPQLDLGLM